MVRHLLGVVFAISAAMLGGCDFSPQPPRLETTQESMERHERERKESIARDNSLELMKWQNNNSYAQGKLVSAK